MGYMRNFPSAPNMYLEAVRPATLACPSRRWGTCGTFRPRQTCTWRRYGQRHLLVLRVDGVHAELSVRAKHVLGGGTASDTCLSFASMGYMRNFPSAPNMYLEAVRPA